MHISASSGVPIYLQLKDQLRRAVAGGVLRPGDRLPAVRDLAAQTVVNPNTVARVYRELEFEGLVETQLPGFLLLLVHLSIYMSNIYLFRRVVKGVRDG